MNSGLHRSFTYLPGPPARLPRVTQDRVSERRFCLVSLTVPAAVGTASELKKSRTRDRVNPTGERFSVERWKTSGDVPPDAEKLAAAVVSIYFAQLAVTPSLKTCPDHISTGRPPHRSPCLTCHHGQHAIHISNWKAGLDRLASHREPTSGILAIRIRRIQTPFSGRTRAKTSNTQRHLLAAYNLEWSGTMNIARYLRLSRLILAERVVHMN